MGIVTLLFFAYLTDLLIDLLPFTFPAQGVCMIITFLLLIILHWSSPKFLFHHVYAFLHPAADFLLACMGLFFTSSFILIPRRDPMPGKEIGLIAAFFLPTFLATWIGTVCIVKALAQFFPPRVSEDTSEDNNADVLDEADSSSSIRSADSRRNRSNLSLPNGLVSPDSTREDSLRPRGGIGSQNSIKPNDVSSLCSDQEAGHALEPTLSAPEPVQDPEKRDDFKFQKALSSHGKFNSLTERIIKTKQLFGFDSPPDDRSLSQEEILAGKLEKWFDPAVYFFVFLVGLPLFFTPGGEHRSLPLFTGIVSLSWIFSRRTVPATWQKLGHPILVTSFITFFLVWGFGAAKGLALTEVLNCYSTGSNYLVIFRPDQGWTGSSPGAGDLLSTLLVGGIVALAFPMFRYRQDLYDNYLRLLAVVVPNCVVSLLLWPWLAHKMGMAGDRAITFAGRFMSTPFGIQFIVATGGDSSLIVVLICITGIVAVLIRDPLFRLCRTRVTAGSDEYFTIGCTIGIVAAAIGTSSLMTTHSRAAATSTVTFVLYGLALLALVAVPHIAEYVAKLAGL